MREHFPILTVGWVTWLYIYQNSITLHSLNGWILYHVNYSSIHLKKIYENSIIWGMCKLLGNEKQKEEQCMSWYWLKRYLNLVFYWNKEYSFLSPSTTLPSLPPSLCCSYSSVFSFFFTSFSFIFFLFIFSYCFLMFKLEFCIDNYQIKWTITFNHYKCHPYLHNGVDNEVKNRILINVDFYM